MSDLDSILNGEVEPEESTAPIQPEVEPKEEEPQPEPEPTPEDTPEPKGEETPGEPPTPKTEESMVPLKALTEERRKRQELEAQLKADDKKAPDVFEDQEGFTQHLSQQMSQTVLNERLNMSEFMARRDFPDLDAKVDKFSEMVANNPALKEQVFGAVSPYHELVDVVSKAEELEQLKDVDTYKEKLRAQIEADIRAEFEAKAKKSEELRDSIPPSLNDVGTKGSLKGSQWGGPTQLDSILG